MTEGKGAGKAAPETVDERAPETVTSGRGMRARLARMGTRSAPGNAVLEPLFRAVKANDLAEARRLNDRIYPTARVFYADPFVDMHNRMKEALVILGRIPCAAVRPPLVKLAAAEIARIRKALQDAKVAPEGALPLAA